MLTGSVPLDLSGLTLDPKIVVRWLTPPGTGPVDPERCELAPGVWIVRERQWLSATIFDYDPAEDDAADPAPPLRRLTSSWQRWALCGRLPTAVSDPIFFGKEGRAPQWVLANAVDEARAMCRGCPVRRQCLTAALEQGEEYGVWGGTSGRQRDRLRIRLEAGESIGELVEECLSH
jgi:WhiB family redox-sensing transcriptional regulator